MFYFFFLNELKSLNSYAHDYPHKTKNIGKKYFMEIKSFHFKTKISLILSIILIIVIVNKIPYYSDVNLKKVKFDDIHLSEINFVNPIFINDTDPSYDWSKTAADNDWCSGTGSFSDPYVIKNIVVNGNGLSRQNQDSSRNYSKTQGISSISDIQTFS